jgi:acyl-CoA reductase-like NAD-dependent aldehyde dehydrogenase
MTLYNAEMVERAVSQAREAAMSAAKVEERQRIVTLLHFEANQHTDPVACEAIHEAIRVILDPTPDLIL